DLATQPKLARIRDVLRKAQPDVSKITIRIAREWSRAADTHVLKNNLKIGQHRGLRWNLLHYLELIPSRLNLKIISLALREQISEPARLVRWQRLLQPADSSQRYEKETCNN